MYAYYLLVAFISSLSFNKLFFSTLVRSKLSFFVSSWVQGNSLAPLKQTSLLKVLRFSSTALPGHGNFRNGLNKSWCALWGQTRTPSSLSMQNSKHSQIELSQKMTNIEGKNLIAGQLSSPTSSYLSFLSSLSMLISFQNYVSLSAPPIPKKHPI